MKKTSYGAPVRRNQYRQAKLLHRQILATRTVQKALNSQYTSKAFADYCSEILITTMPV